MLLFNLSACFIISVKLAKRRFFMRWFNTGGILTLARNFFFDVCVGPCIMVITEECHLLFYCTSYRLNMFQALLCPSSGARDYNVD